MVKSAACWGPLGRRAGADPWPANRGATCEVACGAVACLWRNSFKLQQAAAQQAAGSKACVCFTLQSAHATSG